MDFRGQIRIVLLLATALVLTCLPNVEAHANRQSPEPLEQKIRVRLSTKKMTIYAGEFVELRAEVWNEGPRDVFIGRRLNQPADATGGLELFLKHGTTLDRSMSQQAGDFFFDHRQPLANILPKFYIALAPGNFYGQNVSMDPESFPTLRVPGKYEVSGEYVCGNLYGGGPGNPLLEYAEELKALPYKTCDGHQSTNSVRIEVKARK